MTLSEEENVWSGYHRIARAQATGAILGSMRRKTDEACQIIIWRSWWQRITAVTGSNKVKRSTVDPNYEDGQHTSTSTAELLARGTDR